MVVAYYIACFLLGCELGKALANVALHKPIGEVVLNALILLLIVLLLTPKSSK